MAALMRKLQRTFLGKGGGTYKSPVDHAASPTADEYSHDPNRAWVRRSGHKKMQQKIDVVDPNTPVKDAAVRFVCISDTHCILEENRSMAIPDGDILLHAGDFSMYGLPKELHTFNNFLGTLPHKHKVVIAGNHDMSLDDVFMKESHGNLYCSFEPSNYDEPLKQYGVSSARELFTNCTYLQDSTVQIYGINIYGSPWSAQNGSWGFGYLRGSNLCLNVLSQIPTDTDVLITHGPPCGFGDDVGVASLWSRFADYEDHVGCVDLLNIVQQRIRPKYHIFGHIHEGYGMYTDGTTNYVNAATCDEKYKPVNQPIVFDIPLPEGFSKT